MASNDVTSASVNSVYGGEIVHELGSTHDFVEAVHAGCEICGKLRDPGERVRLEASSEARDEFRSVLRGFSEAKEEFLRARSSGKWLPDHYSPFHWAAEEGHIVILQFLLGVDPKPDGEAKGGAFKLAAMEGHIVIVQFLLGVDPKPDGNAKGEALEMAAREGHSRVVEALLDVLDVDPIVDVHAITGVQSTALCKAAANGHVGVVKVVLNHPKVNVKELARVNNGDALHEATVSKHTAVVAVLEKDLNPNSDGNAAPLHSKDSEEIAPSSVNVVSREEIDLVLGSTLVQADHPGCVICGQLRDAGKRVQSETSSEAMEDFQYMLEGFTTAKEEFLLARSPWEWIPDNYSAFHWAAEEGHVVIVLFLLGADPKPDGKAKGEALEMAAREGHSRVVEALLDVLDVGPIVVWKAIREAAWRRHVGVVEVVLKHPKVNVKELARVDGRTLFIDDEWFYEVSMKHPEFLSDPNTLRRYLSWTLLHSAVDACHTGIVEVLLEHPSVDVNATDSEGSTPLHMAVCLARLYSVYSDIAAWRSGKYFEDKYLEKLREAHVHFPVRNRSERNYGKILELFAKHIDRYKIYQEDNYSKSALEYAYESKDVSIWQVFSQAESVKTYIEGLYKDRQVYVDAANAILVGAALIASVTFGSWLQPPLSYTFEGDGYSSPSSPSSSSSMPKYVDVEHNVALRVFWVFNCFSFYFAMATVVAGACSVLPRRKLFIKKIVQKLRRYLIATSLLLGCSVLCVIIAFGVSGSIVLAPMLKFQSVMIVPTTIGGLICLIWLGILLKNIVEDMEFTQGFANMLSKMF